MYAKALIKGLSRFIKEVEKLHGNTIFYMENYNSCVIGKTLGWDYYYSGSIERKALKKYFNISRTENNKYFCKAAEKYFKPEHWEVIRLFTSNIGKRITKSKWLKLANAQLAKMNQINSQKVTQNVKG